MDVQPNSILLNGLRYHDLVAFLEFSGWKAIHEDSQWKVYIGSSDIHGDPLEIVLPSNYTSPDLKLYFANAINVLSALTDSAPTNIVENVKYYDRDVLKIKNLEWGDESSLPLKVATQQVLDLKQLIAYSACSEETVKPYFPNAQLPTARRMVDHYRFGHTFQGSFGFTVECPIVGRPKIGIQKSLMPDMVSDEAYLPVERRVMERIVRGLVVSRNATRDRDTQRIIESYKSSFNSNMCQSLVSMSMGMKIPLDFSIVWSPIISTLDEEIKAPGSIRLDEAVYRNLEYAAQVLRELEPEIVNIRGLVTVLSAKDNPLGLDTSRSVTIKWIDAPEGKPLNVFVILNKDDYMQAITAHREWTPVRVTGVLKKVGNYWRLTDYKDFRAGWS